MENKATENAGDGARRASDHYSHDDVVPTTDMKFSYTDVELRQFVSEHGKIVPAYLSLCSSAA